MSYTYICSLVNMSCNILSSLASFCDPSTLMWNSVKLFSRALILHNRIGKCVFLVFGDHLWTCHHSTCFPSCNWQGSCKTRFVVQQVSCRLGLLWQCLPKWHWGRMWIYGLATNRFANCWQGCLNHGASCWNCPLNDWYLVLSWIETALVWKSIYLHWQIAVFSDLQSQLASQSNL